MKSKSQPKKKTIFGKILILNSFSLFFVSVFIAFAVSFYMFNRIEKTMYKETENILSTFNKTFLSITDDLAYDALKAAKDGELVRGLKHNKILSKKENIFIKPKYNNVTKKYSYNYIDAGKGKTRKLRFKTLANNIRKNIYFSGAYGKDEKFLSIFDKKGQLLANSITLGINDEYLVKEDTPILEKMVKSQQNVNFSADQLYSGVERTKNGLVLRGGFITRDNNKTIEGGVISSWIVDEALLEEVTKYIKIKENTKVFVLKGIEYLTGDLDIKKGSKLFNYNKILENITQNGFYLGKEKIQKSHYLVGVKSLTDINNKLIGFIGVATSRKTLNYSKIIVFVSIFGIAFIIVLLNSLILNYFFYKIVQPLSSITDTAKSISNGNYESKSR